MTTLPHFYRSLILADTPKAKQIRAAQGLHNYIANSRVKRSTEPEKRGLARYAAKPKAERGAGFGLLSPHLTASLRP